MPKVSVVLTSYNHADFIGESIESILNQTYKDFELYIVDDCSPDNSWEVIQEYAKKDKRIIPLLHEKNLGGALVPDLIKKLKGEYYCVAHCDDKWELTKLEKQVEYLDNHPEAGACFTWVKYIDEVGNTIENSENRYADFNVENKNRYEWLNYFFYKGNCLCHPSIMLRTKIQLEENLFSNGMGALPDFNRWVMLCLKHEIYVYPEELSCFRLRNNELNTSGYTPANVIRCQFDLIQVLDHYKNLSKDEFLKIFPEADEYVVDGKINTNFALARMCIDKMGTKPYTIFGLRLIYDILQDKNSRKEIDDLYNYNSGNLSREVGQHDIFAIIDYDRVIDTSIFLDTGDGYTEEGKLSKKIFMKETTFDIEFDDINKDIIKFRFDPDEGRLRKFKDIEIIVNDKKVDFKTNSSFEQDGWLYFLTTDPNFYIAHEGKVENIKVHGVTEVISEISLGEIIDTRYKKKVSLFTKIKNKLKK